MESADMCDALENAFTGLIHLRHTIVGHIYFLDQELKIKVFSF